MENREKRSRKTLDDYYQTCSQRSTRSRTRKAKTELNSQNGNAPQAATLPEKSSHTVKTEFHSHNENALEVVTSPEKPSYTSKAKFHSRTEDDEKLSYSVKVEMPSLVKSNAVELTLDPDLRSQRMNRSIEENLLAFLDANATADPCEILEDKMMFLDATHSICVVPRLAHVPTPKMYQAILHFIEECNSVGLTVSSFELLSDLEKRHPRVAIAYATNPNSGRKMVELIVDLKVWSPLEETCKEMTEPERRLVSASPTEVSSNIFILLEAITRRGTKPETKKSKEDVPERVTLSQFVMLDHLIRLIQTDLDCRLEVFFSADEKDFTLVQESYMYRLLCCLNQPQKKGFIANLDSIMCSSLDDEEEDMFEEGVEENNEASAEPPEKNQGGKMAALQATTSDFGRLASSLLVLVMKLDTLNQEYSSSTALSLRKNRVLFDTLLSVCAKTSTLDAYLKAISDPSAKLKFIMEYFVNFAPKQVAQVLVDCSVDGSVRGCMDKLLSCFSDQKALKALVKVFKDADALCSLLSHAFQAFLLLHALDGARSSIQSKNDLQESRVGVCKLLVTVLNDLKNTERLEMLPIAEETLFVANRLSALPSPSFLPSFSPKDGRWSGC